MQVASEAVDTKLGQGGAGPVGDAIDSLQGSQPTANTPQPQNRELGSDDWGNVAQTAAVAASGWEVARLHGMLPPRDPGIAAAIPMLAKVMGVAVTGLGRLAHLSYPEGGDSCGHGSAHGICT